MPTLTARSVHGVAGGWPSGYWGGNAVQLRHERVCAGGWPDGYWPGTLVLGDSRDGFRLGAGGLGAGGATLTVTVQVGARQVDRVVHLHDRASGRLVAVIRTSAEGAVTIGGLAAGRDYYAVALPAETDSAAAVVLDPVRAVT